MGIIDRIRSRRVERRESSTISTGGVALTLVSEAELTAVYQAAAGLWERAFGAASNDVLSSLILSRIGRDLFRRGESVYLYRGGELLPVASWDIQGGVEPAGWRYRLDLPGPSGTATVNVGAAEVIHARINSHPESPWRGRGPLQAASITAALLSRLERSLETEARIPVGAILPVPSLAQSKELASQIAKLEGGVVIGESTAGGWDGGAANRTGGAQEWNPTRIGARYNAESVRLRRDVATTILAAAGVPAALILEGTETGAREAWRRFLWSTIAPIGRIVSDEVSRVIGRPSPLDWSRLFASDLAGRSRAYRQLLDAGMPEADARRICGFDAE